MDGLKRKWRRFWGTKAQWRTFGKELAALWALHRLYWKMMWRLSWTVPLRRARGLKVNEDHVAMCERTVASLEKAIDAWFDFKAAQNKRRPGVP